MCNGQPICDKTYGEVTFPATHNSHAVDCGGDVGTDYVDHCHWASLLAHAVTFGQVGTSTNHRAGLVPQWAAGFRAFLIDAYDVGGTVKLCHGQDGTASDCTIGQVDALRWLRQLKALMVANPHDVVTIRMQSYVHAAQLRDVPDAVGLLSFLELIDTTHSKQLQLVIGAWGLFVTRRLTT